jgi:hypothetical protein
MNFQNLTNPENCVPIPSEPVEYDEQEIIDDKSRCKYVSTKDKNISKICDSILAIKVIMKLDYVRNIKQL